MITERQKEIKEQINREKWDRLKKITQDVKKLADDEELTIDQAIGIYKLYINT